ncbi:hypothetical protein E2C01_007597 [Portunus trituberculatus]|uniref:Secreted protein n=1 Tax=Portunus trituberculatus TaxID=210409 RepID=A0A5B7D0V5_PORTR|nr:hypothetical protein [Portunus trituberculatus]
MSLRQLLCLLPHLRQLLPLLGHVTLHPQQSAATRVSKSTTTTTARWSCRCKSHLQDCCSCSSWFCLTSFLMHFFPPYSFPIFPARPPPYPLPFRSFPLSQPLILFLLHSSTFLSFSFPLVPHPTCAFSPDRSAASCCRCSCAWLCSSDRRCSTTTFDSHARFTPTPSHSGNACASSISSRFASCSVLIVVVSRSRAAVSRSTNRAARSQAVLCRTRVRVVTSPSLFARAVFITATRTPSRSTSRFMSTSAEHHSSHSR